MIKKIAESITDWTTKYSPLEGALEEKVICYGLEIFLDNVLAMATFILIGIFVGRGVETFLCLLGFGILRTQAGGFHCETKWKCRLWMLMMLSISIGVSEMVVFSIALRTCFFGLIEVAVLILERV